MKYRMIVSLGILLPLTLFPAAKNPQQNLNVFKEDLIFNEILGNAAVIVGKNHRMKPVGKEISLRSPTARMGVDFQIRGPLSLERARKILIEAGNEILNFVNENKQLRPYIKNYPLTIANIEVSLFIKDKEGHAMNAPEIGMAIISHSELRYETFLPGEYPVLKDKMVESYADALKFCLR